MRPSFLLLTAALLAFAPAMARAADTSSLTPAQKTAVEDVVRELLVQKEPELIMKAAQEMEKRQEKEHASKSQKALEGNQDKIFNDKNAPVGGNPKGEVTLVYFFDYQCGYCKMALESVKKIVAENKDVKVIYKEYPVLGGASVEVAKAALASVSQGKYVAFHEALMSSKEHMSEDIIFKIAKSVGLDVEKLKKEMTNEAIAKMIKDNQLLGMEIGARGTPTFVIGSKVIPGAMPYEDMKKKIDEARQANKK